METSKKKTVATLMSLLPWQLGYLWLHIASYQFDVTCHKSVIVFATETTCQVQDACYIRSLSLQLQPHIWWASCTSCISPGVPSVAHTIHTIQEAAYLWTTFPYSIFIESSQKIYSYKGMMHTRWLLRVDRRPSQLLTCLKRETPSWTHMHAIVCIFLHSKEQSLI